MDIINDLSAIACTLIMACVMLATTAEAERHRSRK